MKKLIITFLILTIGICTTACNKEITGNSIKSNQSSNTYIYPYNAWTSTFQLCWNEFIKLVGTDKIEYVDKNPPLAD